MIDGGSTDGSKEVIEQYADRIDYWVSEPDKGIYNAMNKGIAVAKGDYCNFMNSGDVFEDCQVLENVFQENIVADIVVGKAKIVVRKQEQYKIIDVFTPPNQVTAKFLLYHPLCHQSTFIKSSLLKGNNYREDFKILSDWVFLFDELILKDATYQSIESNICLYDAEGVSSFSTVAIKNEREQYFNQIFSQRLVDYFTKKGILEIISESWNPESCIYKVATFVFRLFNRIQRIWH